MHHIDTTLHPLAQASESLKQSKSSSVSREALNRSLTVEAIMFIERGYTENANEATSHKDALVWIDCEVTYLRYSRNDWTESDVLTGLPR